MATATTTVPALRAELEELWSCCDELFAGLSAADWRRPHGKDWTIADVPYHLAYFDREMIATALERGLAHRAERPALDTMRALNAWNAEEFAKRPPSQTTEQSLRQMRDVGDRIRKSIDALSEADLERRVWIPLFGEASLRVALTGAIMHSWSEYMQLPIRLGRPARLPNAATTHRALDGFMRAFPMTLDRAQAAGEPFALRFRIEGEGGGAWLLRAADGDCTVREDVTSPTDLEMRMKVQTFPKLWNEMQNPMLMMLSGQIRVKGFRKMGRMQKVFPTPKPDTVFDTSLIRI